MFRRCNSGGREVGGVAASPSSTLSVTVPVPTGWWVPVMASQTDIPTVILVLAVAMVADQEMDDVTALAATCWR